ncbi:MAG: Fe-S cluster assembly protein SufD [Myxococcota bacterium]
MNPMQMLAAQQAGAVQSGGGPDWLAALRYEGRDRFATLGWPNRKVEAWRYVKVRPLKAFEDAVAGRPDDATLERAAEATAGFTEGKAARVITVNGFFAPSLSSMDGLPEGVQVLDLAQAVERLPERVRAGLGTVAPKDEDGVVALNTSVLSDAVVLHVPRGVVVEDPVVIVHATVPSDEGVAAHPRVLVMADDASQITVVERFVGAEGAPSFTDAVTELIVGPDATVRHVKLVEDRDEAWHAGDVAARVRRGGRFDSHVLSLSGGLGRTSVHAILAEEGASCQLDGLYLASEKRHLDHYTYIEHAAPHTDSEELYKGVIADESTGTFFGRILIDEGAVKSRTAQLNNNLLLSRKAHVHTRPQLEIDNDDVKAAHGSTVGQLDADALFYLETRGIDPESARGILTWAFAEEMITRLPVEGLKRKLGRVLAERLATDASPITMHAIEEEL